MTRPKKYPPRTARSRIPKFASREKEAEWWDTHDITDCPDEIKLLRFHFVKNLSQGITVRLDPQTLEQLRREAHARGVGPTTLTRMWIMQRLAEARSLSDISS